MVCRCTFASPMGARLRLADIIPILRATFPVVVMSEISHPGRAYRGARLGRDVARRLLILILFALGFAMAQERHNYLAVNGELIDSAGPYYFIAQGDSANAFARAAVLGEAMGLDVEYLASSKELVFADSFRSVTFAATSDIAAGLVKRPGVARLDPPLRGSNTIDSPLAILVDGVAYVPISPLVTAFEGQSDWNSQSRVVTIDTVDRLGYTLAAPRVGNTDGVTRVAIDLPPGVDYEVAAGGTSFVISFTGARADSVSRAVNDGNVGSVFMTAGAGRVTLSVTTAYQLDPAGSGYSVGAIAKTNGSTLYVDFAPSLRDGAVAALNRPAASEPQALAQAPQLNRTVVIDAGHGGHDPGASSRHGVEKQVVLSVALMLKDRLERQGLQVILTRDHDTFLSLQQRSAFATPDRNIFVSIHVNSTESGQAQGIETWVFGEPLDPSLIDRAIQENGGGSLGEDLTEVARQTANELSADILRESQLNFSLALAESVQSHLVSSTGAKDRGVRANLFYVIRTARIPAILVELGFVNHEAEGPRLASKGYQETLADALADGIMAFLSGGGMLARQ